jgi:hypothetical protein
MERELSMRLRNALASLSTLMLVAHLTSGHVQAQDAGSDAAVVVGGIDSGSVLAPEAGPLEAGGDGGRGPDGGKITYPGQGEDNDELIDEYTDDHGCRCSTLGGRSDLSNGLWSFAFGGALLVRARRRRPGHRGLNGASSLGARGEPRLG